MGAEDTIVRHLTKKVKDLLDMTELERIDQAEEFFRRYLQKDAAITQNRENQEYLKTYIHDENYVIENFHFKDHFIKGIAMSVGAGLLVFLILVFISLLPAIILGLFVMIGGTIFFYAVNKYRLDASKQNQVEVNQGITEMIETLKNREPEIIQEKENFAKGLEERVTFISIADMKMLPELRKIIENGEAETCEDAAGVLEQKMLYEQFSQIMDNRDIEKTYTEAENKARFGDPLEEIKKKKKKKSIFGGIFGKKEK